MLLNLTAGINRYFIIFKPRENELTNSKREKKFIAFLSFKKPECKGNPIKNVDVNKAPFIKPSLHFINDKPLLLPAATAGYLGQVVPGRVFPSSSGIFLIPLSVYMIESHQGTGSFNRGDYWCRTFYVTKIKKLMLATHCKLKTCYVTVSGWLT